MMTMNSEYLKCFQVISNFLENNLISSCFNHSIEDKAEVKYKHIPSHVIKWNVYWTANNLVIQKVTTSINRTNEQQCITARH